MPYVTDKTNLEPNYLRNEIRASLLPYLSKLNPNILSTLANVSKTVSTDYAFIRQMAEEKLKQITLGSEKEKIIIEYKAWLSLHPSLRANTLRLGFSKLGPLEDITVKQLDEVISVLEKGVGKKFKRLPHSLRIDLLDGKIILSKN
jgi:tRNA(Ile)-lysidine synthase TilS/MesJ